MSPIPRGSLSLQPLGYICPVVLYQCTPCQMTEKRRKILETIRAGMSCISNVSMFIESDLYCGFLPISRLRVGLHWSEFKYFKYFQFLARKKICKNLIFLAVVASDRHVLTKTSLIAIYVTRSTNNTTPCVLIVQKWIQA